MKLAFVFPGQGSQSVGMLDSFAENPHVQSALKTANDALGENLEELIHTGPAESLNMTVNTQPAMLTASVALYQAWLAMGGKKPEIMAGHSLGEYSALTAAGVFELADAVRLVRFRAKVMQEAVPAGQGGMAAIIGVTDEAVQQVCEEAAAAGVVEAVNVITGLSTQDGGWIIEEGLIAGDIVITSNLMKVRPGMPVKAQITNEQPTTAGVDE